MSAEKIDKQILSNFLQELPSGLPISKVAVVNLPRSVNLPSFIPENIKEKSKIININGDSGPEIINDLSSSLKNNDFVFLRFEGYLPKQVFEVLGSISQQGYFDTMQGDDKQLLRHAMSNESHVVLVSERKFIESQWGNLNNLTTYVLDLEN